MSKHKTSARVPHKNWNLHQTKKMHLNQEDLEKDPNIKFIIGLDECGWGAIGGPVSLGCVALSYDSDLKVKDSKAYSSEKLRQKAYPTIKAEALYAQVRMSSAQYIDKVGAAKAKDRAMFELLEDVIQFCRPEDCVIILDGAYVPKRLPDALKTYDVRAVPKADTKITAVSAASVIAKVERDNLMTLWAEEDHTLARYGITKNKGYASPEHIEALKIYGAYAAFHRLSINLVKDYIK